MVLNLLFSDFIALTFRRLKHSSSTVQLVFGKNNNRRRRFPQAIDESIEILEGHSNDAKFSTFQRFAVVGSLAVHGHPPTNLQCSTWVVVLVWYPCLFCPGCGNIQATASGFFNDGPSARLGKIVALQLLQDNSVKIQWLFLFVPDI